LKVQSNLKERISIIIFYVNLQYRKRQTVLQARRLKSI